LGLAARSVKASPQNLDRMPLPAILPLGWRSLAGALSRHATVRASRRPGTRVSSPDAGEFDRRWTGYAALFDYTPAFEQAPEAARGLAWLLPIVKPYTPLLVRALGLALVVSGLQMVLPVFTQVIVDRVLVDQDLTLLRLLIVAMAGTMAFIVASLLAQRYLLSFAAVRIDAAGLDFITRRLLALPMSYFATRRTGDLQRRIEGVAPDPRSPGPERHRGRDGGCAARGHRRADVRLQPPLALVFLATAPLYALLMIVAVRRLRPTIYDLEDAYGVITRTR
jgi:ABC-type bacteriocin/lantibiotic exporter with double-glycine peptidase domain